MADYLLAIDSSLIGACNGLLVTYFKVQPIVATLITLITVRGIAEVTVNGFQFAFLSAPIVSWLSGNVLGFLPKQIILMIVIVTIFTWLMRVTSFSRYLLAAGGNQAAARLAGVPVTHILIVVYTLSGLLAGIAELTYIAFDSAANPVTDGLGKELDAIAAVVVGGTLLSGGVGSVFGTLVGTLLLSMIVEILQLENNYTLDNGGGLYLNSFWQNVIRGIFLLIVVIWQSRLQQQRVKRRAIAVETR